MSQRVKRRFTANTFGGLLCAGFVVLGALHGSAGEAVPPGDLCYLTPDERQQLTERLSKYVGQNLQAVANDRQAYREMLQNIQALKEDQRYGFVPTYLCRFACALNESVLLLFESRPRPQTEPEDGYWRFSTSGRYFGWQQSKPFRPYENCVYSVLSCGTTNCFASPHDDTFFVQTRVWDHAGAVSTNKMYFALDVEKVLVIRNEKNGGLNYFNSLEKGAYGYGLQLLEVLEKPLTLLEIDLESLSRPGNGTPAQILSCFMYLNCKSLSGEFAGELEQLHASKRMQRAVESLITHEHPWVHEAAEYYLVHFGDLSQKQK